MAPLLVLLIIAFPVCGLIGYYMKTKNQERIKLIEKGINPDEGMNITEYRNLNFAVLFISFAVGLLTAHLLVISYEPLDSFVTYLSMILLFGGIGFLINYLIVKNRLTK